MTPYDHLTVTKQVASKLTQFGFPNNPRGCTHGEPRRVTDKLFVAQLDGIVEGSTVFALCIDKGHIPVPAVHVLDFRVGGDIYGYAGE